MLHVHLALHLPILSDSRGVVILEGHLQCLQEWEFFGHRQGSVDLLPLLQPIFLSRIAPGHVHYAPPFAPVRECDSSSQATSTVIATPCTLAPFKAFIASFADSSLAIVTR